jgi:hypothetical protein
VRGGATAVDVANFKMASIFETVVLEGKPGVGKEQSICRRVMVCVA